MLATCASLESSDDFARQAFDICSVSDCRELFGIVDELSAGAGLCAIQQLAAGHSRRSEAASRSSFKQRSPTVSKLGRFKTNAKRRRGWCNDKCTGNTRGTERSTGTRPARSHQWLCG